MLKRLTEVYNKTRGGRGGERERERGTHHLLTTAPPATPTVVVSGLRPVRIEARDGPQTAIWTSVSVSVSRARG